MSHNYPSRLRCSGSLSDQPSLRTEANTVSDSRFRSSARFRTCSHLIFRSPHSHSHSHSHPHSSSSSLSSSLSCFCSRKNFRSLSCFRFFPYLYLSPHPSLFQLSFLYLLPFSLLFLLYLSFLILFRYLFSLLFSVLFPFIVPRRDILQNMFSHKCIWRSWVNECDEKV